VDFIPITRRDIKGRPFEVGFECSSQPSLERSALEWIA
jgi:hypothetical protein